MLAGPRPAAGSFSSKVDQITHTSARVRWLTDVGTSELAGFLSCMTGANVALGPECGP